MPELEDYLAERRKLVNQTLDRLLPPADMYPRLLHEAIRYSVFAGGKRLRPILAIAAAEAVGGEVEGILPVAAALECIHTYSLIHDDLPSMDDDDFRRGKPTCHKVYGEALAILAGDALLTLAFELLSQGAITQHMDAQRLSVLIQEIARAAGSSGMVGGQSVDILSEGKEIDQETLLYLHTHKTGALIQVSVIAGGLVAGASEEQIGALSRYGERIGLAFQIVDDLLDVTSTTEELGKPAKSDLKHAKATFPALMGKETSMKEVERLTAEAKEVLRPFEGRAWALHAIAGYLTSRRF
ncbi:MAG: polyprenyl synthetase family protein [candidate division NC10 bacterium]|nr:polyprenyl synthetase family protein [candidate division NC10 bacterium]